jgi:lysophospholipase L1-like esterase
MSDDDDPYNGTRYNRPMNTPDIRICFIGDSYVHGTGDDDCLGWAGRLCAAARRAGHNITYYNLGVRRETSADIARRWQAECVARLLPGTQNHLVFSFGANDVSLVDGRRRVAEDETLANLQSMLETAKPVYRTLVVGPPPVADAEHDARLAQLSVRMQGVAAGLDIPYIATLPALIEDRVWREEVRGNDGSHPRGGGYARLAGIVAASDHWWFGQR